MKIPNMQSITTYNYTSTVKFNLVPPNYKCCKCITGPGTKQTQTHKYTNT
jgi:hypothetical protein